MARCVISARRGRRKIRVVSPVTGRAGCPSRELDCLKPAGTEEGVSARIYVANSLGAKPAGTEEGVSAHTYMANSLTARAKEGRGSDRRRRGTGEGIGARIHVVNSQGDRARQGRRRDCRHSANSL